MDTPREKGGRFHLRRSSASQVAEAPAASFYPSYSTSNAVLSARYSPNARSYTLEGGPSPPQPFRHLCVSRPLSTTARPPTHTLLHPAAVFLTQNGKTTLNAMTTPTKARRADKKPKGPRPDFADAHKACRTPAEGEQLALVVRAGWTSAE